MSQAAISIVGGGIAGLLTAWRLAQRGHPCQLYEARSDTGHGCSRHAGGMLAPLSELDLAEPVLARLGLDACARWRTLLGDSAIGDLLDVEGSLLVAHRPEWPLLAQLQARVAAAGLAAHIETVERARIAQLEPWMSGRLRRGIWIATEGVVHPERLMPALRTRAEAAGVAVHTGSAVERVAPGCFELSTGARHHADIVIDCRGLGARDAVPLRGVRGEYIVVAPRSPMPRRPIRLMHPRYPLYIVPRPDGRLYVGATQLESEHDGPMQVRSALELLSALHSLAPGFADADIVDLGVGVRPAFANNLPQLAAQPGLISLNGLFRHGYLLAPQMSEWVVHVVEDRELPDAAQPFCQLSG